MSCFAIPANVNYCASAHTKLWSLIRTTHTHTHYVYIFTELFLDLDLHYEGTAIFRRRGVMIRIITIIDWDVRVVRIDI
jgi:hypothetical protein